MTLERVGPADVERVERLLDQLQDYSMKVDGVPRVPGAAQRFLTATPEGWDASAKHTFIICIAGEPVGLVDLVAGYPTPSTVFIGLLAIVEGRQRLGLGRIAMRFVETFACETLHASTLRPAVVATNPVAGFWKGLGFRNTGEVKPYEGSSATSTAQLMVKTL